MNVKENALWIAVLWLILSGICLSYPEDYGPFEENEKPKLFPIHTCREVWPKDPNSWDDGEEPMVAYSESGQELHIRYYPKEHYVTATLSNGNGNVICGPVVVYDFYSHLIDVYIADLNGDKKEDFIVWMPTMGCGLAAHNYRLIFVLSDDNGYRITSMYTMSPDVKSFVDFNDNGQCRFIHTGFIYGEKGRDGKVHNYWVYNLLQFQGNKVVLDNSVDERFPKWIWYTFKPNHKATTQLNDEQKRRLWEEQKERHFSAIRANRKNPDAGIVKQNSKK